MVNWGGQSALGICALCYIWNLFSVVVFHTSIVDLRRGVRVSLSWNSFWCSGLPEIYAWLEGGQSAQGICALCYMWNWCGVVVFHGSMVDWRRGQGQSVMNIIQCNGLPETHARLQGVHLPKWVRLPNINTLWNLLLLHRGLFYERPIRSSYLQRTAETCFSVVP